MVYGMHLFDLGVLAILASATAFGVVVGLLRLLLMALSWTAAGLLAWLLLPQLRHAVRWYTSDSPWVDVIATGLIIPLALGFGMFLWAVSWTMLKCYAPRRRLPHGLWHGLGGLAAGYVMCCGLYALGAVLWSPAEMAAWSASAYLHPYLAAPGHGLAQAIETVRHERLWHVSGLFKALSGIVLGLLVCTLMTYVFYKREVLLGLLWRRLVAPAARPQSASAAGPTEAMRPAPLGIVATAFSSNRPEPQDGIVATRPATARATLSNLPSANAVRAPSWKTALLWARLCEGIVLSVLTTFLVLWSALPDAATTRHMAATVHIHLQKTTRPDGTAALRFAGSEFEYGFHTPLEHISPHFLHATIASEDWRFYKHGVPYKAAKFLQASLQCAWTLGQNVLWGQSRQCVGNSTITQQVARNLWIGEARSVYRKIKEFLWAIKMETALSKDEILTYYVNRIHLGRRNFGAEMASRAYFGKSPDALNLYEAVVLAAAIKSPAWNWATSPQQAIERGNILLASMKKRHYLPQATEPIPLSFQPVTGEKSLSKPYLKHFYQWLEPEIAAILADQPDGQYKVITTLHAEAQLSAEQHLQQAVQRQQKRGVAVSQGAMMAMRPDGAVTIMVGGVGDSPSARGMNRAKATQGLLPRPPASAFKPIIYLAALEHGLTPQSRIDARAIGIPMGSHEPPYAPRNHEDKVYETATLTEALVHSINTATVRLLYEQLTIDAVKALAQRLGIDPRWLKSEWGLALGSSGVPLIEMTTAYSVFANGGYAVQPYGMSAIYNAQGDLVWRHRPARAKRVVEARHVHALNTMLAEAARHGTGRIATRGFGGERLIAGKTGTGDAFVDAWFMGYTADLTTGVWLGNDVPQPMIDLYGGTAPARVWNSFMQDVVHSTPLHPALRDLP